MLRKFALVVVMVAACFAIPAMAGIEGDTATVYLKDGSMVHGKLLQATENMLRIDPDGAVGLRTLMAEKVDRIKLDGSGRVLSFPLNQDDLTDSKYEEFQSASGIGSATYSSGLGRFGVSLGLGRVSPLGDYYEGIGSGFAYELAGLIRFSPDLRAGSFFLRMTLAKASIDGTYNDYYSGTNYSFEGNIRDIGAEFGRTTSLSKNDTHLWGSMGLGFIKSTLISYSESKTALRFGAGAVIGVNEKAGVCLNVTGDFILKKGSSSGSYYYDDSPDVAGMVLVYTIGGTYDF